MGLRELLEWADERWPKCWYFLNSEDWDWVDAAGCEAALDVCDLADRIDCLLATLERGGEGGALARACRDDLTGLPVLADWCEENGLPATAGEARHLSGLLRCMR